MPDHLTKEQIHLNMSAIRAKNTKPELLVRKFLFNRGFRYRINHPRLPGHPDLVLRKYRTVIFVNGCFWHGHENCKYFHLPKTNIDFWSNKIERNKVLKFYLETDDFSTSTTLFICVILPSLSLYENVNLCFPSNNFNEISSSLLTVTNFP